MKDNNTSSSASRRRFLKTTSALAASSMLLPFTTAKLFGHPHRVQIPTVTLNNGIQMPIIGFGTNTLTGDIGTRSVSDAISVGFRLIDTASVYGNEKSVGEGINKSGIKRNELFVTSKIWVDDYSKARQAFETSIGKLQMEYLDMYLLHRPRGDVKAAWQELENLYGEGKIKAIGISNFEPHQMDELMQYAKVKPVINQIETHAFFQQPKAHDVLIKNNIQMEAWSPFAAGRNNIFTNETLAAIGKKYGKNNAQVSLRWHYQRGIVAIPRSKNKAHMIENLNIFDFELSASDVATISRLDLNVTQFPEWG